MTEARPILTWLYVPGSRRERFESAVASGADVVVLDWEDSVPAAEKDQARAQSVAWLGERRPSPDGPSVEIRVNAWGSPRHNDDLAAVAEVAVLLMYDCRRPRRLNRLLASPPAWSRESPSPACSSRRSASRMPSPSRPLRTASRGSAWARPTSGPTWVSRRTPGCFGRAPASSSLRAAGLAPPAMSVWTDLSDMAGLSASCLAGRGLGLLGRAAIHPRQLMPIRAAFRPEADEIRWPRGILTSMRDEEGVTLDSGGRMVDEAVVRTARRLVALEDAAASRIDTAFHSA